MIFINSSYFLLPSSSVTRATAVQQPFDLAAARNFAPDKFDTAGSDKQPLAESALASVRVDTSENAAARE